MIADRQTLRDLEIFECRDGRQSVFDLLDRTRTSGGRTRLRERFRRPLSDAAAIGQVQQALRAIGASREAFARLDRAAEGRRLAALDAYLNSRTSTSAALGTAMLWADAAWTRLRYPALFDEALAGVNLAVGFVDDVARLAETVLATEPPPLVREVVEPLASLAGAAGMAELRASGGVSPRDWAGTLRLDRRLREGLKRDLLRMVALLWELDALVSMADAVRELGLALPAVSPHAAGVEIRGVRHPFVHGARPNDLAFAAGERLLFLTGPNMAGKTTYLKACGIAVYLAHLGMGVPAAAMRLAPLDRLFTGINTEDNVRLGYSYFYSEVRRVREISEHLAAGERACVLFDEMFRGTNVKDAADATLRVVRGFAGAAGSVFLVSSHLVELADELDTVAGVRLGCFEAQVEGSELRYTYQLRAGASPQRLGLVLLEREGVFELLDRLGSSTPA